MGGFNRESKIESRSNPSGPPGNEGLLSAQQESPKVPPLLRPVHISAPTFNIQIGPSSKPPMNGEPEN